MLALIGRLRAAGKTVLLVSHRLEDLWRCATASVFFRQGKARMNSRTAGLARRPGARDVLKRSPTWPTPAGPAVHEHEDGGDEDIFVQRRQADEHDDVVDDADDQNPERRADDRSAPSAEGNAAEDHARDRLQRVARAGQRVDQILPGGDHDPGDRRGQGRRREREHR